MNKALCDNPGHIETLCTRLALGSARQALSPVAGGFHHKMWRLDTDNGSYAIKQLTPDGEADTHKILAHYNTAEAVAESFSQCGICAVHALQYDNNYLQLIEDIGYLVYPWTDAVAHDAEHISATHALQVARVMAKMHLADIDVPNLPALEFDFHPENKMTMLVQWAVDSNTRSASALKARLPEFLEIAARHKMAVNVLENHKVVSHGDLDHKNVLWDGSGTPIIIDWESVRKINPTYEVLLEALDWCGITANFDDELLERFLSAYVDAGGVIEAPSLQASFDCVLGDWLNWLMYNVGRSVDPEDAEQRAIGSAQVELSLTTINRLGHILPWLLSR